MTDVIDEANERAMSTADSAIKAAQAAAGNMPKGYEGDCEACGWHTVRLVRGKCAPCRDRDERVRR